MGKHKDRKHVKPRPRLMQPRPGETWQQRHARRLATARLCEPTMRSWLSLHGIALAVERDGNYWRMERGGHIAEWWPAYAALAIDRDYGHRVRAQDHLQVQEHLRAAWKLPGLDFIEGKSSKGVRI